MKIALTICFSLLATSALADNFSASLNGSVIDNTGTYTKSGSASNSTIFTGSVAYNNVGPLFQEHASGDFLYQDVSGKTIHENADMGSKLDYNLNTSNYIQGGLRLEYDNLRKNTLSLTSEIGDGFRIIHTNTMHLSNEFGVGIHSDQSQSASPVISDSIWFNWAIAPKITLNNKFLTEQAIGDNKLGYDTYVNNIAVLSYALTSHLSVHLENRYHHEKFNDNKTSLVGLSLSF